jgi:hypothetical protein
VPGHRPRNRGDRAVRDRLLRPAEAQADDHDHHQRGYRLVVILIAAIIVSIWT